MSSPCSRWSIPTTPRCSTTPSAGCATRRPPMAARRARPRCTPGSKRLASEKPDIVLIHDAARPFVTAAVISRAIEAAGRTGAAVPADPRHRYHQAGRRDRQRRGNAGARAAAHRANAAGVSLRCHSRCASPRRARGRSDFTDDAALAEWAGLTVATFEGDPANMKLTTPEDFVREEARLGAMLGDIRTGTGYDVHAFGDGDHLMICGVRVPHTPRLSRPFRWRRRPACAGRRHSRRAGGRRYRLALSAQRHEVEGRLLRPIPEIRGRPRHRARRPHRQSRSDADLRAAEDRPAARHHARADRRDRRPRISRASP